MNIRTLHVADIELPPSLERLRDLAYDYWWSWSPRASRLFSRIDPEPWRRYHNPVQLLINVEPQQWMRLLSDPEFVQALRRRRSQALDEYRSRPRWYAQQGPQLPGPVAYFSMEFGIHESLGIYSGGLGVLAGDHCKAASDLGVPAGRGGAALPLGLLPPDGRRRRLPAAHLSRLRLRAAARAAGAGPGRGRR